MHRTPILLTFLSRCLCIILLAICAAAQSKSTAEIDVFKCWSYPLETGTGRSITADGTLVFAAFDGGRVEALTTDGKRVWSGEYGGEITSNILAAAASVYVVTTSVSTEENGARESTLRALSKETGVTGWSQKISAADWHQLASFNNSLLVTSQTGSVQLVDARTGSDIWDRKIPGGLAAEPSISGDKLALAATTKQAYSVALATGQIEALRILQYPVTAISAAADGDIFVGDERGGLSLIERGEDKPKWRFRSGGQISSLIATGDHILAASHDNYIYFLDAAGGGLAWKRRLPGRDSFLADHQGKYALAAVLDGHSVAVIDLSTGKIAGQIPVGGNETVVTPPAISGEMIYLMTDEAVYAYSTSPCSNKNDGRGK